MRAVIQRVHNARVIVDGKEVSSIGKGVLTLLGVAKGDALPQVEKLIRKICDLRIFEDESGKMNLSLKDIRGEHLIVSQFTLLADCRTGRRPSFTEAEQPDLAAALYNSAIGISRAQGVITAEGVFQADMKVDLVNDGPATFILDA